MNRVSRALLLGLLSFVLMMFVGEAMVSQLGEPKGLLVTFAALAVYFFVCQLLLSRGNPDALRTDWRVMLALGAVPIVIVAGQALAEKRDVLLSQGIGILLACSGGILAGAFAASRAARRAALRR
jgi:hypothetical protein